MLHRISIPLGLVSVPPLLVSLPLAIYRTACVTQVSQLQARLTKVSLPPNWVELRQQEMSSRLTTMTLVNFRPQTIFTTASFVVNIHEHLTWTLQCYNSPIETDQCQAIANVPQKLLCVSDVVDLLTTVQSSTLCCGNPAEEFRGLVELHDGTFKDPTGMCNFLFSRTSPSFFTASSFVIYVGTRTIAYHDMQSLSYPTIRHSSCEFLLPHSSKSKRCKNCASFRNNLRIRQKRVEERTANRTSSSSNVPYSCLSEQELKTRMKAIHAELRRVQKQRDRLKLQLSEASEKQGLILDDDTHADLKKIMLKESTHRGRPYRPQASLDRCCSRSGGRCIQLRGMELGSPWPPRQLCKEGLQPHSESHAGFRGVVSHRRSILPVAGPRSTTNFIFKKHTKYIQVATCLIDQYLDR